MFVGDQNVVDVDGLAHERAGLGVRLGGLQKVRTDARAEVFGLADIDDLALGVFIEVHAGLGWKRTNFLD